MADSTVHALTDGVTVAATDEFYATRSPYGVGNDVKLSGAEIASYVTSLILIRTKLLADATYYVSTGGNDSTGDGTIGNPWLTILHAWNYVCGSVDISGFMVTIQMANGTYTDSIVIGGSSPTTNATPIGGGTINFQGNVSSPLAVVWDAGSASNFFNNVTLTSLIEFSYLLMKQSSSSYFVNVITVGAYANLILNGLNFGTAGNAFVQQIAPSNVTFSSAPFSFTGNTFTYGSPFQTVVTGSILNLNPIVGTLVTATGTLDWSSGGLGFVTVLASANVYGSVSNNTGTFLGSRYYAVANATIQTYGYPVASSFPGNSAGNPPVAGVPNATGGLIQ